MAPKKEHWVSLHSLSVSHNQMFQLCFQQQFWQFFFSSEQVCCAIATNCLTIQKNKDKNTARAMFLVLSVQCLSAVEGVCLHLPLPLKGRASLGHMFPLGPNKDVWDQNLQMPSHTFSNVAYSAFRTGIFYNPRRTSFWQRMRQINGELSHLLHRKQDLCQLLPSHCTSSAK